MLWASEQKGRVSLAPGRQIASQWKLLVGEAIEEKYTQTFQKVYILHDFLLALCVVSGALGSPVQMYLWAGVELLLTVLLLKFRVFKDKIMNIRQIVLEILFFLLATTMAAMTSANMKDQEFSASILITYCVILCLEVILIMYTYIMAVIHGLKGNSVKVSPSTPIVESADAIKDREMAKDGHVSQNMVKPAKLKILKSKILSGMQPGDSNLRNTLSQGLPHQLSGSPDSHLGSKTMLVESALNVPTLMEVKNKKEKLLQSVCTKASILDGDFDDNIYAAGKPKLKKHLSKRVTNPS
jgi:hypothetical protein